MKIFKPTWIIIIFVSIFENIYYLNFVILVFKVVKNDENAIEHGQIMW